MSWLTQLFGIDRLNKTAVGHAIIQPISDELKTLEKPAYDLLTSTFHTNVAGAANSVLHAAFVAGEADVAKVQASVLHGIIGAVGNVIPSQVALITDAVNAAVTSAEHWAEGAALKVVPALVASIVAKLGFAL